MFVYIINGSMDNNIDYNGTSFGDIWILKVR